MANRMLDRAWTKTASWDDIPTNGGGRFGFPRGEYFEYKCVKCPYQFGSYDKLDTCPVYGCKGKLEKIDKAYERKKRLAARRGIALPPP